MRERLSLRVPERHFNFAALDKRFDGAPLGHLRVEAS
jgi:hypothetical protein